MAADRLANIVSFGAAGRVEEARLELDRMKEEYERQCARYEQHLHEAGIALEGLIADKQSAYESLRRIRDLTAGLSARERTFVSQSPVTAGVATNLPGVEATLRGGDLAMAGAKAGGAAASSAIGAWALVGALGSASTGTAISSLSGGAATNAILAWFGGGALSAGGAGVAGGVAVIGGMLVLPAVALTAMFTHAAASKKIEEMKSCGARYAAEFKKCEERIAEANVTKLRALEIRTALQYALKGFEHEFNRVAPSFLSLRWYERAWRWLRFRLTGRRYSTRQVQLVSELCTAATALAGIIDQPVMDEEGRPQ